MAKRKRPAGPSQTTRFEIFKRDSFTCQYCGRSAPEALLELDHIEPVAKGGGNDVINLVTACKECNAGKSDRRLSDDAVITKQVDQLKELEERRQQLEMMVRWRTDLVRADDLAVNALNERWRERTNGWILNDEGKRNARKWIASYGFDVVLRALEASANQYLRFDDAGKADVESVQNAYLKIGRIAPVMKAEQDRPHLVDVNRIMRILFARGLIDKRWIAQPTVEAAVLGGVYIEDLIRIANTAPWWSQFRDEVEAVTKHRQVELGR